MQQIIQIKNLFLETIFLYFQQINYYISRELERASKSSPEQIEIKINTNFSKRILGVLGIDRIKRLSDIQKNSVNNQYQDLYEEHNNNYDTNCRIMSVE